MKPRNRLACTLCILLSISANVNSQMLDDSRIFDIVYERESSKVDEKDLLKVPQSNIVKMPVTTHDGEEYICHLPQAISNTSRKRLSSYNGPSPGELLEPIYTEKICSYRLEAYWSYELCHGRYVLQYHEDRELNKIKRSEFFLGNFHEDYATRAGYKFDQLNPPTRIVEGVSVPYYPVSYTKGTSCDITGKPRTTTVLYVCDEEGGEAVISLDEVASCHYEAIVLTSRLCAHPAFAPVVKHPNRITCYDQGNKKDPRPFSAIQFDESEEALKDQFIGKPTSTETTLSAEAEKISEALNREFEDFQRRKLEQIKNDHRINKLTRAEGRADPIAADTQKIHEQIAIDTVKRILSGRECIYGGSGWWRYEFCYGDKVEQFHVLEDGQRQIITLGKFDKAVHMVWIEQNPSKRPIKVQGKIKQVSQLYVRGDICEETNAHRSVEVKIRCSTIDGSKIAIGIALEEPSTCFYRLTIESERFCDVLQEVDDYGLIDVVNLAQKARANAILD